MYEETLQSISESAASKAKLSLSRKGAYLIHSAMAGAYVGLGVILIFALGTPLFYAQSPFLSLVMAGAFGIALSLVIIAGADLFTGNAMVMPVGVLSKKVRWQDLGRVFFYSYIGNLLGSVLVAFCALQAEIFSKDPSLLMTIAAKKMNSPFSVLFFKAILCNWLVVLAVWCAFRAKTESGKLIMIAWCLLGFVGSGYEHSIANMTLLTLANFLPNDGSYAVSWTGWIKNLVPVTLGNILSGALFVGGAYYFVSPISASRAPSKLQSAPSKKAG